MVLIKNLFRTAALVLAFVLITGVLSGCGKNKPGETASTKPENTAQTEETGLLKLPYSKSEPFNPFKVKSLVGIQLSALIYDSLFRTDSSYKPVAVIAKSYMQGGLKLTVEIKTGLTFSDGEALDADDVVYSFEKAHTSPAYAGHLSNIGSAAKSSEYSVVFFLKNQDPYAVNCLDFAVVKYLDSDDSPLGSGRYILTDSKGDKYLKANEARLGGFFPSIKKILLVNVSDSDILSYSLQIGSLSFIFSDLRNGDIKRMKASILKADMNNLVYLSFNSSSPVLKTAGVRRAVSMLIDRKALAAQAFQGYSNAAYSPFNPAWISDFGFTVKTDKTHAVLLLRKAGFSKINSSGIRYNSSGNELEFTLLVNKDNIFKREAASQISSQLSETGIKVNINELPLNEYTSAVKRGDYDMYLGEVMLNPDMNLSPLLSAGGSASFGIDTKESTACAAYKKFLDGKLEIKEFIDAFNADTPFMPICYRCGMIAFDRSLSIPQSLNTSDIYSEIGSWSFVKTQS